MQAVYIHNVVRSTEGPASMIYQGDQKPGFLIQVTKSRAEPSFLNFPLLAESVRVLKHFSDLMAPVPDWIEARGDERPPEPYYGDSKEL